MSLLLGQHVRTPRGAPGLIIAFTSTRGTDESVLVVCDDRNDTGWFRPDQLIPADDLSHFGSDE